MIFPQKLWRLVNEKTLNSAIRWAEDGTSFFIFENPFKHMCLGKENHFFYTRNTKSFVRQLHLYGFRKINKNQFTHNFFRRDQPALLKLIKRSYKPIKCKVQNNENPTSDSSSGRNRMSDSSPDSMTPETIINSSSPQPLHQQQVVDCLQQVDLDFETAFAHEAHLVSVSSSQINCKELPPALGALVVPNNYDDPSVLPLEWYENSLVDINYNYDEDCVLTMYNNDIYPNTRDDNNITL